MRPISRILCDALRRVIVISLGRLHDLFAEAKCGIPAAVGRAAQLPILPCTGLGFSCRPSRDERGGLLPHLFALTWRLPARRYIFCDTVRHHGIWPVVPRLEQKRAYAMVLRPADTARQRFSPGILPGGVRTFLSEVQKPARRYPRLGIKEPGATTWPRN